MKTEASALHEAMAGLHGEMGAVQRELDGAKVSKDKLGTGGEKLKLFCRVSLNRKSFWVGFTRTRVDIRNFFLQPVSGGSPR